MTIRHVGATAVLVTLTALSPSAQNPPQNPPGQRPNARLGAPPSGQMSPQQVQELVDGWALVESQRVLQLTEDQIPTFVPRYLELQLLRRRLHAQRQRHMREMQPLLQSTEANRDEVITDRLRVLDELNQRTFQEVRKAEMNVDAVLAPVQRARFRFFEDRLELRKLEMLNSVGRGRAAGPAPGAGRKGGFR